MLSHKKPQSASECSNREFCSAPPKWQMAALHSKPIQDNSVLNLIQVTSD